MNHRNGARVARGGLGAALLTAGLCLACAGCWGGPDYPTATVTGKVTIQGQPVPKGFITFSPAAQGPVTGAPIEAGQYRCENVPAGKHKVTFQAQGDRPTKLYDAVNKVEHEVPTDILPPQYRAGVDADIEAGQVVRDFAL